MKRPFPEAGPGKKKNRYGPKSALPPPHLQEEKHRQRPRRQFKRLSESYKRFVSKREK